MGYGATSGVQCDRPYAWQPGATFWASSRRVHLRPLSFWSSALEVLLTDDDFRLEGAPSGVTNFAAQCFESVWHFALGQPLFHFLPAFEAFEELPLVPYRQRCAEANATCAAALAAVAPKPSRFKAGGMHEEAQAPDDRASKGRRRLCSATHGEMDGEDVGVSVWSGLSVEQRDHSCCTRCRELAACEFWVRSTKTNDCWLRRGFRGFLEGGDRRGAFVSSEE